MLIYRLSCITLTMANIYTTQFEYLFVVLTYFKLLILDTVEYYYVKAILSMPAFVFGAPIITVEHYDSDSESDATDESKKSNENTHYDIFISQLIFIFKTGSRTSFRTMNGCQLRPLIDQYGRFHIGHIHKYYPSLDTIIIKYVKFPCVESNAINSLLNAQSSDVPRVVTRVLDVTKRYDIRNNQSCKLGIVL